MGVIENGIRDKFGLEEIIGDWFGAYCLGLRRGDCLSVFLCTGNKGTAPGVLFCVVRICVLWCVIMLVISIGFVDVVIGGARITQ